MAVETYVELDRLGLVPEVVRSTKRQISYAVMQTLSRAVIDKGFDQLYECFDAVASHWDSLDNCIYSTLEWEIRDWRDSDVKQYHRWMAEKTEGMLASLQSFSISHGSTLFAIVNKYQPDAQWIADNIVPAIHRCGENLLFAQALGDALVSGVKKDMIDRAVAASMLQAAVSAPLSILKLTDRPPGSVGDNDIPTKEALLALHSNILALEMPEEADKLVCRPKAQMAEANCEVFDTVVLPYLKDLVPLVKDHSIPMESEAYTGLFRTAVQQYSTRHVPKEPAARDIPIDPRGCGCPDCKELDDFFASPRLKTEKPRKGKCDVLVVLKENGEFEYLDWQDRVRHAKKSLLQLATEEELRVLLGDSVGEVERLDEVRPVPQGQRTRQAAPEGTHSLAKGTVGICHSPSGFECTHTWLQHTFKPDRAARMPQDELWEMFQEFVRGDPPLARLSKWDVNKALAFAFIAFPSATPGLSDDGEPIIKGLKRCAMPVNLKAAERTPLSAINANASPSRAGTGAKLNSAGKVPHIVSGPLGKVDMNDLPEPGSARAGEMLAEARRKREALADEDVNMPPTKRREVEVVEFSD